MTPRNSKNEKNGENGEKAVADIESVIKLLKKKELQTKILKKILPKNVTTDNKPV
jgi:hypothetical protein